MSLAVHSLPALSDNYIYALVDERGQCVVVDPGEAAPVLEFLRTRGLKLHAILCTHHHMDHVAGVPELLARTSVPVWCSLPDRERIPGATRAVSEGEPLNLLGSPLQILAVPGHTLGQIAFYFPEEGAVFVGDTLFSCGCGRLFEGSNEQMFNSLAKLGALPPSTRVYFGHEYTLNNIDFVRSRGIGDEALLTYERDARARRARGEFTTPGEIGRERLVNPFLYAASVKEFKEWREARNHW